MKLARYCAAMSQENVDRFLKAAESFNRLAGAESDEHVVEEYLRFWHPDVRFHPQQAALEGGYVGHAGLRAWLADLAQHYEYGRAQYTDVRGLGDRVLALGTLQVTGRGSGIKIEVPLAIVAEFREGLMADVRDFGDWEQALRAAGLAE